MVRVARVYGLVGVFVYLTICMYRQCMYCLLKSFLPQATSYNFQKLPASRACAASSRSGGGLGFGGGRASASPKSVVVATWRSSTTVIDFAQEVNSGVYHFGTAPVRSSSPDDMDAETADSTRDPVRDELALLQHASDTLAQTACDQGDGSSDRRGGDG